jgi:hypothetical protein
METTLNLNQLQQRYEDYEGHTGIIALNKAIDKVLIEGKTKRELPNGDISRQWINSVWETKHAELVEMRNCIINCEFADLKSILDRA